jgi:pyrroloquinoline quinone biosynthesis protein D
MSATQQASSPVTTDTVPRVGGDFRLQYEPAQQCHVLLYPEGMVKLNGSAGEIMTRCDGQRSVAAIVADLEAAFDTTGLADDVSAFVRMAGQQRWLVWD